VVETVREKFTCRDCEKISQAPAPFHVIARGWAGASLLAMILYVNKVSHVFTLGHVADMLGEDEDWLFEVAEEMDTEDGQLRVVGVGEDGVMAFTDDGIENLKNLIDIHKEAPWIMEERRQVLAAIVKPKAEKPDEV
jgi:hypothetical protein